MPAYVVRPSRDEEFYVLWSTITGSPYCWGSRAEMRENWQYMGSHVGEWDEVRFDRADEAGSSAMWPNLGDPYLGWNDDVFIYQQRGILRRANLKAACARLGEDERVDIGDLLEPFDDETKVRPA